MWIVVIEMLLALGLAVFIVWWTMFHKPNSHSTSEQKKAGDVDTDRSPMS